MKFKAKMLGDIQLSDNIEDEEFLTEGKEEGWIDNNNYIYGWYVDGYIVGPVVDVGDDYIALGYWCKVDEDTLTEI